MGACPWPGAHVQGVDAVAQPFGEAGDQRDDRVDEGRVVHAGRLLRLEGLEPGVGGVGDAASVAERPDDLLLDLAHQRDVRHHPGEVVGPGGGGERGGVLGGQRVRRAVRLVLHDAADDHAAEPLAHVPLVELRRLGDVGARGRRQRAHGVEQARLVADAHKEAERSFVEHVGHEAGELLLPGCVR